MASRSSSTYLANLHTHLLALAHTGSLKKSGSPAEETFGSSSVQFVAAPWDVLESYYFRAVEHVATLPEASRVEWLEKGTLMNGPCGLRLSETEKQQSVKSSTRSWIAGAHFGTLPQPQPRVQHHSISNQPAKLH